MAWPPYHGDWGVSDRVSIRHYRDFSLQGNTMLNQFWSYIDYWRFIATGVCVVSITATSCGYGVATSCGVWLRDWRFFHWLNRTIKATAKFLFKYVVYLFIGAAIALSNAFSSIIEIFF